MLQGRKIDFTMEFKRPEHEHFQSLYRFVRVCKNCYSTYVCITKSLTKSSSTNDLLADDGKGNIRGNFFCSPWPQNQIIIIIAKHPERKRVDAFNSSIYMKNPLSITMNEPTKPLTAKNQTTRSIFEKTTSSGFFTSKAPARKIDINASSQRLLLGVCSILPPTQPERITEEQNQANNPTQSTTTNPKKVNSLFDLVSNPSKGPEDKPETTLAQDPEERIKNVDQKHRGTV